MSLFVTTSRPLSKNYRKYKSSFLKPKIKTRLHRTKIKLRGSLTPTGFSVGPKLLSSRFKFVKKKNNENLSVGHKTSHKVIKQNSYKTTPGFYIRRLFFSFQKPKKTTPLKVSSLPYACYWSSQSIPVQFSKGTIFPNFFFNLMTSAASKENDSFKDVGVFRKTTPLLAVQPLQILSNGLLNSFSESQATQTVVNFAWLQLHKTVTAYNCYSAYKTHRLKKSNLLKKKLQLSRTSFLKYSWVLKKRKLAFWNKKFKNSFIWKRPSIYFTYTVPTSFRDSKFTRRLIPELPFALRGSYWINNIQDSFLQPFEVSNELSFSHLLRTNYFSEKLSSPLTFSQKKFFNNWDTKVFRKKTRKKRLKAAIVDKMGPIIPVRIARPINSQPIKKVSYIRILNSESNPLRRAALRRTKTLGTGRAILKRYKKKLKRGSLKKFRRRVMGLLSRSIFRIKKKLRTAQYYVRKTKVRRRKLRFQRTRFLRTVSRSFNGLSTTRLLNSSLRSLLRKHRTRTTRVKRIYNALRPKSLTRTLKTSVRNFLRKTRQSFNNKLLAFTFSSLVTSHTPLPRLLINKTSPKLCVTLTKAKQSVPALIQHLPIVLRFWTSPIVFRSLFIQQVRSSSFFSKHSPLNIKKLTENLQTQMSIYYFGSRTEKIKSLNTWTVPNVNYRLRKKLLRVATGDAFVPKVTAWYYQSLIRFMENCTGRKVALHIGPFVDNVLTFEDRALCHMWALRVKGFQRILGHKIFAVEALDIVASSLRLKDPTFLANWIRAMLKRMSFWKFRLLFRYVKFLVTHLFQIRFPHFQFKGFKLRLKGKISVAGNARTRALHLRVGSTSHSTMDNRIAYDLSYVGTFTGVLGLKLWFFY